MLADILAYLFRVPKTQKETRKRDKERQRERELERRRGRGGGGGGRAEGRGGEKAETVYVCFSDLACNSCVITFTKFH